MSWRVVVGLVGLGVGLWLGCGGERFQGWFPAGPPTVIAIGDGTDAVVCSTLEEFQVGRVGKGGVRWTRTAPRGSSCGELSGGLLTVTEVEPGAEALVYLDVVDGRERWRVALGGSAWRTFRVGEWRVDYDDSRRVWLGPRDGVEGARRAVRELGTPDEQVEVVEVGGVFGAVIERRVATSWVVASEGGVVLRAHGEPGSRHGETAAPPTVFVSGRWEVLRLGEELVGPPVLVGGRIVRGVQVADGAGALEVSSRLGEGGATRLSWSRVSLSKRGRPFVRAAVGDGRLAWLFIELEEEREGGGGIGKSMQAVLIDLRSGQNIEVVEGAGEASTLLAMQGSRVWGDGSVTGAVVVDHGPNEMACLRRDGSAARLVLSATSGNQGEGARGKVRFGRQVGDYAMVQRDGEVLIVDATRCEVAARFDGWSGLASVGTDFVWVTGPGRMQRIRWGEQAPDAVIENRSGE